MMRKFKFNDVWKRKEFSFFFSQKSLQTSSYYLNENSHTMNGMWVFNVGFVKYYFEAFSLKSLFGNVKCIIYNVWVVTFLYFLICLNMRIYLLKSMKNSASKYLYSISINSIVNMKWNVYLNTTKYSITLDAWRWSTVETYFLFYFFVPFMFMYTLATIFEIEWFVNPFILLKRIQICIISWESYQVLSVRVWENVEIFKLQKTLIS